MLLINENVANIVRMCSTLKAAAARVAVELGCDLQQATGIALDIRAGIPR